MLCLDLGQVKAYQRHLDCHDHCQPRTISTVANTLRHPVDTVVEFINSLVSPPHQSSLHIAFLSADSLGNVKHALKRYLPFWVATSVSVWPHIRCSFSIITNLHLRVLVHFANIFCRYLQLLNTNHMLLKY